MSPSAYLFDLGHQSSPVFGLEFIPLAPLILSPLN